MASPQLAPTPLTPAPPDPFARKCPNCDADMVKVYCAQCGQKHPDYKDYSLWLQLKAWVVEDLIAYDGRIWGTLGALFLRPGKLTREYFDGRRAKYLGPMRIFVLANVALWFLSPYVGVHGFDMERAKRYVMFKELWLSLLERRAEWAKISVDAMIARVEAVSAAENQLAVLCLSPMLAVGLWMIMAGKKYLYMEHLIFAAHFFVIHISLIILTWAAVMIPLAKYGLAHPEVPWALSFGTLWKASLSFQHLSVAPALFPFMFAAIRRAYALSTRDAVWRAVLATVFACFVTRAFFDVAFALVLIFA